MRCNDIIIVDPIKLNFQEQVELFSQAELVIGATGAGMSNIIFCKPGTNVIALNAEHHKDNRVFSTIAAINNLNFNMVLGQSIYKKGGVKDFVLGETTSYISSYFINTEELDKYIKKSLQ